MLEVGIGFVFTSVNPKLQRHTLVEPFGGRTQGCLRSKKHARQSRWEAQSRVLPALFPTEAAQEVSALEPLTAGRTEMYSMVSADASC